MLLKYMDKGDLVPDNLIIDMVSSTTKTLQSILLDGFKNNQSSNIFRRRDEKAWKKHRLCFIF